MPLEPGLKTQYLVGYVVDNSPDWSFHAHSKKHFLGFFSSHTEALNRVLREGYRQQLLMKTDQLGRPK